MSRQRSGDPESPLRWTSHSCRTLAAALRAQGFRTKHETMRRLLQEFDYSLQIPAKVLDRGDHPERDAQFAHLHDMVQALQAVGEPVISVDGNKKDLIGDFDHPGRDWQLATLPVEVNVSDYPISRTGWRSPMACMLWG